MARCDVREALAVQEVLNSALDEINNPFRRHRDNFLNETFEEQVMYAAEKKIERLKDASWMSDEAFSKLKENL